jgi:hypothetical protein
MRYSNNDVPRRRVSKAALASQRRTTGDAGEEWTEAECLSVLTAPRSRRSVVEYMAWERLGYLRGYIDKPPIE